MESGPEVLEEEAMQPPPRRPVDELLSELACPTLVVHGTDDHIISHEVGV
jgi:hypothetical protein